MNASFSTTAVTNITTNNEVLYNNFTWKTSVILIIKNMAPTNDLIYQIRHKQLTNTSNEIQNFLNILVLYLLSKAKGVCIYFVYLMTLLNTQII
jgi:hypothetical protein